jgi:F-box domain
MQQRTPFELTDLAPEELAHILSFLDIPNLLNSMLVSKTWYQLIKAVYIDARVLPIAQEYLQKRFNEVRLPYEDRRDRNHQLKIMEGLIRDGDQSHPVKKSHQSTLNQLEQQAMQEEDVRSHIMMPCSHRTLSLANNTYAFFREKTQPKSFAQQFNELQPYALRDAGKNTVKTFLFLFFVASFLFTVAALLDSVVNKRSFLDSMQDVLSLKPFEPGGIETGMTILSVFIPMACYMKGLWDSYFHYHDLLPRYQETLRKNP